jgi:hypothetical protein
MKEVPYRELVGLLLYIATRTRPDIMYPTNMLCQVASNPGFAHWEAAKQVVRYLKGTRDQSIVYSRDGGGLYGYADAGFASETLGWKSVSGYVFILGGGPISWSTKKQSIITLSTAEAEYLAMTHAAKELIWIRLLLSELFGHFKYPTLLLCDNQSAITMAKDDTFHARTKYIALPHHFIRQCVSEKTISLSYVQSKTNIADMFTKALPSIQLRGFSADLGLSSA